MLKLITIAAVSSLLGMGASAATLTAKSTFLYYDDFVIDFDDSNGNNLVGFSEVTSFSGFKFLLTGVVWPDLIALGEVPGITDPNDAGTDVNTACSVSGDEGPFTRVWAFGPNLTTACTQNFNYEVKGIDTVGPVPLPSSLLLLFTGIGSLGLMLRMRPTC